MGVRVRKKGKRWGIFIVHRGKRKALIRWENKREAEAVAARIRKDLSLADLGLKKTEAERVPFDTYALWWLDNIASDEYRSSTIKCHYRPALLTHLIPHFGSKCITEFTPKDIRAYVEKKRSEGLKFRTVTNHLVPLRVIFNKALEEEIVASSPVANVRLGRGRRGKDRQILNTLTVEELHNLLETIREHYPDWYPLFYTLAHTGLRFSEAVGLKWGDIQFGQGPEDLQRFVHVQRAVVLGETSTPKTGRDRRVDLSIPLREVLMAHQVGEFSRGRGRSDDWLFCRPNKEPKARQTAQVVFKRSLTLAGLRKIRIHDLRHTFATLHLRTYRSHIQWVSAQLGHSSISMTVDTYGAAHLDTDPTLADRFGSLPQVTSEATKCNLSATDQGKSLLEQAHSQVKAP